MNEKVELHNGQPTMRQQATWDRRALGIPLDLPLTNGPSTPEYEREVAARIDRERAALAARAVKGEREGVENG